MVDADVSESRTYLCGIEVLAVTCEHYLFFGRMPLSMIYYRRQNYVICGIVHDLCHKQGGTERKRKQLYARGRRVGTDNGLNDLAQTGIDVVQQISIGKNGLFKQGL